MVELPKFSLHSSISDEEMRILDAMHKSALKHAAAHPSLVLSEFDPEKYPHQRLANHFTRRNIGKNPFPSPETISLIASAFEPEFQNIESLLLDKGNSMTAIGMSAIGSALNTEYNVLNGTDHLTLEDILFGGAAISNVLRRKQIRHRAGLVLSKMGDFLEVRFTDTDEPIPLRIALLELFDEVYVTIPKTESTSELFNDDEDHETFSKSHPLAGIKKSQEQKGSINDPVLASIKRALERGSVLNRTRPPLFLSIAFPGTLNEITEDPQNPGGDIVWVGQANPAISKITSAENTVVIGSSTRLKKPAQIAISELPVTISQPGQVAPFMRDVVVPLARKVSGSPNRRVRYDHDGSKMRELKNRSKAASELKE